MWRVSAQLSLLPLSALASTNLASQLLASVSYDPAHDTLFFAGDLLAKSAHATSLSVIDFLTANHAPNGVQRIFPVRGNHDTIVIQWRAWREWFEGLALPVPAAAAHAPFFFRVPDNHVTRLCALLFSWLRAESSDSVSTQQRQHAPPVSTGREFLQLIEAEWALEKAENEDPEEHAEVARKRSVGTWREAWWRRIPQPGKGRNYQSWKMFTDHYWLARCVERSKEVTLLRLTRIHSGT